MAPVIVACTSAALPRNVRHAHHGALKSKQICGSRCGLT
eukprot:IDg9843t1